MFAAPPEKRRRCLSVPVWMEAGSGEPALSVKDFLATLEGRPARIVSARGPSDDMIILLVLDLTEELGLVEIAKDALVSSIQVLPPNAYVGLMRAQDGLRVLLDPTSDRDPLFQAIRALPVSGKAGLLETVETAMKLGDSILAKAAVRLAVLYITDSSIYNYRDDYINPVINYSDSHDMSRRFPEGLVKEKISRLERKLSGFESPLFIVHLDYRSDRLNEAYQAGLLQLASAAGGHSAFCRSRQEIPEAIAGTLNRIASAYRVDIQLPERPSKVVQVQLESGKRTLVYRNRFVLEEK